ncbi:Zinc transporter, ZIP family [hydrothermal vent metagenome]|uniref:Zinc transporter, ZIP family n=1 Tax=hydrothermal vent metagenome TaxID=652676 RepID=A0A3B1AAG4_9ZZZZ
MSLLFWIIIFSLLGGIISVIAAAVFLLFPDKIRTALLPHFVSFAVGALLGAAFLALIPDALSQTNVMDYHQLGLTLLIGLLGFFLMEKMVLWRHCHEHGCEAHEIHEPHQQHAAGTLILIGDGVHNLVDGILIAAAFMTDFHLGVITSMAVAAHEIPQEVGDFAILLHSGYSRKKAFIFNILASVTTIIGAVVAYYSLSSVQEIIPYILALAASSFIYIAVADLIPGLHKRVEFSQTLRQITLITAGILVIYFAHATLH